jgi:hypothetical protein
MADDAYGTNYYEDLRSSGVSWEYEKDDSGRTVANISEVVSKDAAFLFAVTLIERADVNNDI